MVRTALPPIPFDTDTAARYVYHPNHPYLRLGRQVDAFLKGDEWVGLCFNRSLGIDPWRLALITVFQYKEQLSDTQAVEAARVRTDWKYALHLPLVHLGIRPDSLGHFRAALLPDQVGLAVFQQVIDCLEKTGFFSTAPDLSGNRQPPAGAPAAARLLKTVCINDRLFRVTHAMAAALEAIAVKDHDWLRTILLPYWYSRYDRRKCMAMDDEQDQLSCAERIGCDIHYLLEQLSLPGASALKQLPSVQDLRTIWWQNYERTSGPAGEWNGWQWRSEMCVCCPPDVDHNSDDAD